MQNANLGRICVSRMALNESIKSTLFVYVLFYYYYNWNSRPRYHGDRGWNKSCVPINMNPFLPFPWNCSHNRDLRGFTIIIVTIIFLLSQRIRTVNELWDRANGFSSLKREDWNFKPFEELLKLHILALYYSVIVYWYGQRMHVPMFLSLSVRKHPKYSWTLQ